MYKNDNLYSLFLGHGNQLTFSLPLESHELLSFESHLRACVYVYICKFGCEPLM